MAPAQSSSRTQWSPFSGFLDRMACCAADSNITDLVVLEEANDMAIRPPSQQTTTRRQASRPSQLPIRQPLQDLPSPTFSPSRRELQQLSTHNTTTTTTTSPVSFCCTNMSYAGSTATTLTMQSYDDEEDDGMEEIRSNATTEIVSHHRQQPLLSTTLVASAEKHLVQARERERQRRQLQQEEDAYQYLTRVSPAEAQSQR